MLREKVHQGELELRRLRGLCDDFNNLSARVSSGKILPFLPSFPASLTYLSLSLYLLIMILLSLFFLVSLLLFFLSFSTFLYIFSTSLSVCPYLFICVLCLTLLFFFFFCSISMFLFYSCDHIVKNWLLTIERKKFIEETQ